MVSCPRNIESLVPVWFFILNAPPSRSHWQLLIRCENYTSLKSGFPKISPFDHENEYMYGWYVITS
jgi:hypothetical protein